MTEERKKFLANISKEERLLRNSLEIEHYELKANKELANAYKNSKEYCKQYKEGIAMAKTTIKALKKQLPAPRVICEDYFGCSVLLECVCGKGVYPKQKYCENCGRKLR